MKSITLLTTVLAVGMIALAPADDPETAKEEAEPVQAAFLFEWIELDHREANKLVRRHADDPSAATLRKRLGKMIRQKKARLAHSAYLHTRQLQRAKTESIDEHIYPTEFDPPEIPRESDDGEPVITPATPTAFDVRNVGTIVEIEPHVRSDGETISLNLAPEIVQHLCDRGVGGNGEAAPEPLEPVKHPAFYVMKLQAELTVRAGDFTLAGMFTPPGQHGRRTLLIVHAKVSD